MYQHAESPARAGRGLHRDSITGIATTGADDGAGIGMIGGLEDRDRENRKPAQQKMVRSSIACARCRRSKVKCKMIRSHAICVRDWELLTGLGVNTGVNSTCKACVQAHRECTYPPSGATTTPKRPDPGIKQEDGEIKKRVKKGEDAGRRNSARNEDPLESPVLNRKVWEELFAIFKLHFATEMPFLHPPTFKNRMKQAAYPRDSAVSTAGYEEKVLLLGVLTLTARFHPDLVAHHASAGKPADPLDASEYYATALKTASGPHGSILTTHSLEGIQALLMLALYEWGQSRGLSAWIFSGLAIRLAQSMGLAYEDDPDNGTALPKALPMRKLGIKPQAKDQTIEKEVRRRTMWSCFVMDRLLSAGKNRPNMISVDRLKVQLPCSEDEFLFGQITTHPNYLVADSNTNMYQTNDHGVLSRYMRLVEIFGRFSEWSCAGGRRTEKHPPWESSTRFYQLSTELQEFDEALPPNLTFTEDNLSAHIEKRSVTAYVSMHMLYCLCLIMLHREYIPFIPLRCKRPQGPLDEPTFPPSKYNIPKGFWEDSAESMSKAARDIVVIARTCQDSSVLPESPLIGFAVYQAAFVGVYLIRFQHMDTGRHITKFEENDHTGESQGKFDIVTAQILKSMGPRLKMATGYCITLIKMHDIYKEFERGYRNHFPNNRYHFEGGGLAHYTKYEEMLKGFGSLTDHDKTPPYEGSEGEGGRSRASTNEINEPIRTSQGLSMHGLEVARDSEGQRSAWAAVNQSSPLEDEKNKFSSPWNYHSQLPYPPQAQSNPPSLISPSNGDSTSSINSPFVQTPGAVYASQMNYTSMSHPQHQQPQQMPPPGGHPQAGILQQNNIISQGGPGMVQQNAYTEIELQEQFLAPYEQIGTMTNSNFDNLVQDDNQMCFGNGNTGGGNGSSRTDFFHLVRGNGTLVGIQQMQMQNNMGGYVDQTHVQGVRGGGQNNMSAPGNLVKRKRGVDEDEFRFEG